jgi:hypothetical protein
MSVPIWWVIDLLIPIWRGVQVLAVHVPNVDVWWRY